MSLDAGAILVAIGGGLAALGALWLVRLAQGAKRLRDSDAGAEETRAALQRLIALNAAAVGAGFMGAALMLVGFLI